jgi:uncharacterized protein
MLILKVLAVASWMTAIPIAPVQQADPPEPAPVLVVTGDSEVAAAPDRAVVVLGATAQAPQATAAQQQVNQVIQGTLGALAKLGVPEAGIQTTGLSLHPVYSAGRPEPHGESEAPRIVAFRASNTVRIELEDLSSIGAVIDAGTGSGANELQGISFELRDDTLQRANALAEAVRIARQKAEAIAQAAGATLIGVQRIEEGGVQAIVPAYERMAMQSATPVEPGQVRVLASVRMTYRLGVPTSEPPPGQRR